MTSSNADTLIVDVVARLDERSFRQIQQDAERAGQQSGGAFGGGLVDGAQQGAQDATRAVEDGLRGAEGAAEQGGQRAGGKLAGAFQGALAALPALAAGAALAVGAAAAGGVLAVTNMAAESAQNVNEFQAQLGVTVEEAERLGKVAEGVFGDNWTGSLSEAAAAVTDVRREIKGLAEDELQSVTGAVVGIAETFGEENARVAAAVQSVMDTTGVSAKEATDLIARGFQTGLNSSGDFLDTLTEYAPQFKAAGLSAGEMYSLLQTGAAKGALGIDKVADTMAEFRKITQAGGEDVVTAFNDLGLNGDKIVKQISSGQITIAEAFQLANTKLTGVTDTVKQQQIGVALMGTLYEDLGQKAVAGIDLNKTSLKDLAGGVDAVNTRYTSFRDVFTGVWRQVQVALLPVGKELLGIANEAMPAVKAALSQVTPVVTQVVRFLVDGFRQGRAAGQQFADQFGPQVERALVTFRPVLQAIGPLFAATFGLIKQLWETVLRPVLTAIAPLIAGTVATIGNTLNLVVRVVTGVVNAVSALLRGDLGGAVKAVQGIFEDGVTFVVRQVRNMASTMLGLIRNLAPQMAGAAADILRGLIRGIENGAGNVVAAARNMAGGIIDGIKKKLNIQSPSRVMQELGEFTAQGFINGIASQDAKVKAAAQATAKSFITALSDLKNEKALGKIDLSTYISTLEQVRAKLEAQIKGVKEGTPAYTQYLAALVKVNGELNGLKGKSGEVQAGAKALTSELAKSRAELEKSIARDAWVASLERMTTAQLKAAQATARAAGEADKYNAIKAELERREQAATAAVERATAAAKAQADQLASAQKAIRDGQVFEAYTAGLGKYTDAQLNAARANAYAAGDGQKFNAVLAEQKSRLEASKTAAEAAAQALSDLNDAQIAAANSAYQRNPQGATDAAFRQSFGAGDEGLVRSLAAVTGLSVAAIRADVQGALDDAKRFAPEAAAIIERVWAANLQQRREAAAEEIRLNAEINASYEQQSRDRIALIRQEMDEADRAVPDFAGMAAELTALGRPMTDLVALATDYATGTDDAAAAARAFLATLADEEAAFARRLDMANETRDQIVQNYRDEQAAADDAAVTVDFLRGQLAELAAQGIDAKSSGFREYLTDLAAGTGQAAAAATELLANFDAFWTAAQFNAETPGPMDAAPAEARRERVLETLTAEQVAWRERTREVEAAAQRDREYAATLEGLTIKQLEASRATALQNGEMEKHAVLQAEVLRLTKEQTDAEKAAREDAARKASLELNSKNLGKSFEQGREAGDESGAKAVLSTVAALGALTSPLYVFGEILQKINPAGAILEGLFSVLAEPIKAIQEPLKLFGTLLGSLIAPVLQLLAPILRLVVNALVFMYDALATLVKNVTFGFVDITRKEAAPTAAPAPVAPKATAPATASGSNVVQIPSSQVTVMAAPEWVGVMTRVADKFESAVDRMAGSWDRGVKVNAEVKVASGSSSNLAWELGTGGV